MIVRSVLHNVMCSLPLSLFPLVHQESEPNMLVNPIPLSGTLLLVVKRLGGSGRINGSPVKMESEFLWLSVTRSVHTCM